MTGPAIAGMWTSDHVNPHTVYAFLNGQSWGDVRVIAHLEANPRGPDCGATNTLVSACHVTT